MWALGFWLDGFLPIWPEEIGPDVIRFDIGVNVGPAWIFRIGVYISFVTPIKLWRYTTVKR